MELKIDARSCDLGKTKPIVPGYNAAQTADIEASRAGRSLTITIPSTGMNDAAMGHAHDPHTAAKFNAALHTAELSAEGVVLLAGTARLLSVSEQGYTLEIRDGGARWATNAAQRMFNTLGIEYLSNLSPSTIQTSWTDASPVKFFPIIRDEYPQQNASQDLQPAERLLSVDDYHPFLHVAALLKQIFVESGYRLVSSFFESTFFRSLYMSGAYSSRDTTAATKRMGFFARRLSEKTAVADHLGRVYADAKALYNTVGNIVETATPQTLDADKEPIPELFNSGGCFEFENGQILFRPLAEVSVGFEYYLKYTTDHRILSRTQLTGFDSLYLGAGAEMPFTLANRYKDRRAAISTNYTYRVVVFNHTDGNQYRLLYNRGVSGPTPWVNFSTRSALVSTPAAGGVSNPALQILRGSVWMNYPGDWALYDGYIEEVGQTTVELRVRTAAEIHAPTSPKYFNQIYLFGAEPGMKLTLHKVCSLQPRFVSSPGFGSVLRFADVAQHRVRQIVLLEALGHLFNLRFYTDEATKEVYVEPADDFFGAGAAADWRSKTDFSQPITLADLAQEVHESRRWGYMQGDGAVMRFNAEADSPLGEWRAKTDSFAAKEGEKRLLSPLFQPTWSSAGHYLNAPSAWIMQVGDRDSVEQDGGAFAPRIVCFAGMKSLPASERWGFPSNEAEYPLAAFHFQGATPGEGFTLGFEDRDGVQGLHRFYDRQVAQESSRERISLWLQLAPHELESLLRPGTETPDIRSVFLLNTGADSVRATLHTIDEYDPERGSVRCTFTRLPED